MDRIHNILNSVKAVIECPPATQDITINLANRKTCVEKANYGPANQQLDNNDFGKQNKIYLKHQLMKLKP